jgi:hypothetical protein
MTDLTKLLSYENYEDYEDGSLRQGEEFATCNNTTIISTDTGKIAQTWIARDDTGYGRWGYSYTNDELSKCESGSEIWWRMYMKMPEDFKVESGPGKMKGFRIGRLKKSDNANRGYVDWYIKNDQYDNPWTGIVEFEARAPGNSSSWDDYNGTEVKKGQWQMFEVYCYLHPENGIMRLWQDGVLMGSFTRPTIAGPSNESYVNRLLFLTYYNGSSPQTQGLYFDHHTVAIKNSVRDDSPYLDTDADGNRFIGMDTEGGVVEPPVEPPVPPVEPPVVEPPPIDPPEVPMPTEGATVHVDKNAVFISTDLPVIVVNSTGGTSFSN